jgi:predicted nucleic acid-binding Zn finger protein
LGVKKALCYILLGAPSVFGLLHEGNFYCVDLGKSSFKVFKALGKNKKGEQ